MFAVEKLAVSSCSRQWYVIQLSFLFLLHVTLTASYVLGPHHDYFKRAQGGNPCPDPEKPFPCKSSLTCIPMAYVCDQNEDCEDAYDENPDVCTAVKRPPVEDILAFLQSEEWMVENMFAGKSLPRVAHGLAVSQTLRDLQRRLDISNC